MSIKGLKIDKVLEKAERQERLNMYRDGLAILMEIIGETKDRIVITLDGRDSAGKGYNSRKITEFCNPNGFCINTFGVPNDFEKQNWFFRYEQALPEAGKIAIYDRSWYNRALVEPVMGFCSKDQYEQFMSEVNDFEKNIIDRGILLNKFYLSISKKTQEKRLAEREQSPRKRWKKSSVDEKALEKWDKYTYAKRKVLEQTSTEIAPWYTIKSNTRESVIEILKLVISNVGTPGLERIQNEIVDLYGEPLNLNRNLELSIDSENELLFMQENDDNGKKFDF